MLFLSYGVWLRGEVFLVDYLEDILKKSGCRTGPKNVILETTRVSTSLLSKDYGHQDFTEKKDGFYALLGSVLGKSVIHMLLDLKAEIGYRCVDLVILIGKVDLHLAKQGPLLLYYLNHDRVKERRQICHICQVRNEGD